MSDDNGPQVSAYWRGLKGEFPDGPPTAVITHHGFRLVVRFEPGDFSADGPVQELSVFPGTEALEPRALREFAPEAELYLAYARAAMRILAGKEGTHEERWRSFYRAGKLLRDVGGPGRGLSDEFYRTIAEHYRALVEEGEPHPVKTLGETHHVTISAASRWVTEARRRRYILD